MQDLKTLARLANFCVRAFQAEGKNKCKIVSSWSISLVCEEKQEAIRLG